jgi:outer membrane protein OmpA-like peptidoglycan-associated protein
MKYKALIFALAGLMPFSASALSLVFPANAVQTSENTQPFGSTAFPVGVFSNGTVPMQIAEGTVTAQAWKLTSASLSTLQILAPLRQQLLDSGYEIVLDCETDQCGGFDFRYEINLLPEPEMHVDLGDFRYISARRVTDDSAPEYICLIVSRGGDSGFVQMTRVGPVQTAPSVIIASSKSTEPGLVRTALPKGELETLLNSVGRAPLDDLDFITGSSKLGDDTFASLAELASYLNSNPGKSVALVGHTDAEGSLVNNLALSKKRAASVVKRLISSHGVSQNQLEAAGVGYLVPRASNLTEGGRDQNRRVEVILTSIIP